MPSFPTRRKSKAIWPTIFMVAFSILFSPALRSAPAESPKEASVAVVKALYKAHFANKQRFDVTFKQQRSHFTKALCSLMDVVDAKAAANPNEVVGLDFDPIINAQEEANSYEVGAAKAEGKGFLVPASVR